MTPNVELFRKIYKQITEHPETHDQGEWEDNDRCGTTRCVAGWALHFTDPDWPFARYEDGFVAHATTLLGLSPHEARTLFFNTDNDEAVALVKKYAGLC